MASGDGREVRLRHSAEDEVGCLLGLRGCGNHERESPCSVLIQFARYAVESCKVAASMPAVPQRKTAPIIAGSSRLYS
jgi:hypothetical protein